LERRPSCVLVSQWNARYHAYELHTTFAINVPGKLRIGHLLRPHWKALRVCPTENQSRGNLREKFLERAMSTRFRPYYPHKVICFPRRRRTGWRRVIWPISYRKSWIPWMWRAFTRVYEGDGRRNSPYDPRMLLKVLVYAYASGVFSFAQDCQEAGRGCGVSGTGRGNFPDHRTVNGFRQGAFGRVRGIFGQVVKLAREMKLIRMGTLAIDGTKVRANASKRKGMSYGRMKEEERKLQGEIAELFAAGAGGG